MSLVVDTLSAVLLLTGSIIVFLTAVAMFRVKDAVTRVNSLSPVTALGLPLIVVGEYVHALHIDGFTVWGLARLVVTIVALLVVSSVASNALARAAVLSGAEIDPRTSPNDLAEDPD